MAAVTYVYIGGMGRSGSTLISGLLGQLPGVVEVGELRGIWRAVQTNERCSCGLEVSECGFWHSVGGQAFGGWDTTMVERMIRSDEAILRHRQLPLLLAGRPSPDVDAYLMNMAALIHAVRIVSGARVIVDSTKDYPYFLTMKRIDDLNLHLVHLVRDPRGVAFSWTRSVERPEFARHAALRNTPMARFSVLRSSLEWVARCALFETARAGNTPAERLRYEELVSDPDSAVRRIEGLCRLDDPRGSPEPGSRTNGPRHTVGGNRIRFRPGPIEVTADEEWRWVMRRRDRWLVNAVTFPLSVPYGYLTGTASQQAGR